MKIEKAICHKITEELEIKQNYIKINHLNFKSLIALLTKPVIAYNPALFLFPSHRQDLLLYYPSWRLHPDR
jgi:hypothetical protein